MSGIIVRILSVLSIVLPSVALADVQGSTWGAVKGLYRESTSDTTAAKEGESAKGSVPTTQADSYWITWVFDWSEPRQYWSGLLGDRTGGGTITACGGSINSHSGADYYSRDLLRTSASTWGRPVYAGFAGYVIRARWDGGYGYSVVVWDPSRNLQLRYAHLSSIAVGEGMCVPNRAYLGRIGNTSSSGSNFTPHLHLTLYQGLPLQSNGLPGRVGYVCLSSAYARPFYFF